MDVASKRAFWAQAEIAVGAGTTVVFATHDLVEADTVAERVVVLGHGRVLADATPRELKSLVAGKVMSSPPTRRPTWSRRCPASNTVAVDVRRTGTRRGWTIRGDRPELVVHGLVRDGWLVDDLTVVDAELEQAFLHLTADGAGRAGRRRDLRGDPMTTTLPVPVPAPSRTRLLARTFARQVQVEFASTLRRRRVRRWRPGDPGHPLRHVRPAGRRPGPARRRPASAR